MKFSTAFLAIGLVLVVHGVAIGFGIYNTVEWFDIPMHISGGFAMGLLALSLWHYGIKEVTFKDHVQKQMQWWITPLFVLGFVALIGIGWEWYEFVMDTVLPTTVRQPGIADTMADFLFDILGAIASLFFLKKSL